MGKGLLRMSGTFWSCPILPPGEQSPTLWSHHEKCEVSRNTVVRVLSEIDYVETEREREVGGRRERRNTQSELPSGSDSVNVLLGRVEDEGP